MVQFPEPKYRKTQIKIDGKFINCELEDVKKGMIFRLFEPDGTPVMGNDGHKIWVATKDAVKINNKNVSVKCKPYKEVNMRVRLMLLAFVLMMAWCAGYYLAIYSIK